MFGIYLSVALLLIAYAVFESISTLNDNLQHSLRRNKKIDSLFLIIPIIVLAMSLGLDYPVQSAALLLLAYGGAASFLINEGIKAENHLHLPMHKSGQFGHFIPWLIIFAVCAANAILIINQPFTLKFPQEKLAAHPLSQMLAPAFYLLLISSFAIAEELIWRHYALLLIIRKLYFLRKPLYRYLLSAMTLSFIFTIGHLDNVNETTLKFAQIFGFSLVLSYLRLAYGTLYSIILHILFNFSVWLIAILRISSKG